MSFTRKTDYLVVSSQSMLLNLSAHSTIHIDKIGGEREGMKI